MRNCFQFSISDTSQVGEVRRRCVALAHDVGFDEPESGKVAIVATEIANNQLRHAQGGMIFVRILGDDEPVGLELVGLDSGPGMRNVERCLADGFSTIGTAGTGLGAITRLSSESQIYTLPDVGTAVFSRLWAQPREAQPPFFDLGVVSAPYPGETVCGDGWSSRLHARGGSVLVVDGLGHGLKAFEAAGRAVRAFEAAGGLPPPAAMLADLHAALGNTRGAAVGVTYLSTEASRLRYAGVGNINAAVVAPGGTLRGMANHGGIIGHGVRKIQEFEYPWDERGLLVMWSDGLATHWDLSRFPGLWARHPSIIAAILYREFRRGRDDATVLVLRRRREREGDNV